MTYNKKGVAFFDLDGTITHKDSFIEFIKYSEGNWKFFLGLLFNFHYICLYYLKLHSNHKLKECFFSFFFLNKLEHELIEKGKKFSRKVLPKLCYSSALDVINWHKKNGHDIYIITASSSIWLEAWCNDLNLFLIGTKYEVREGKYTGKILGKNCFGKEKLNRLETFIYKYDFNRSYGYGDQNSDIYFLNKVNKSFKMPLTKKNFKKKWLPEV